MSDLRTGMLETNVKTGAPAEENASSLHRVRTQYRMEEAPTLKLPELLGQDEERLDQTDQLAADRIMHDLYDEVSSYTTPVEDYLEGQFEDAEADPEAEAEEEQEDAE